MKQYHHREPAVGRTFRLPISLADALAELAHERGSSQTAVLIELLRFALFGLSSGEETPQKEP